MYIRGIGHKTMEEIYNGIAKASGNSAGMVKAVYGEVSKATFKWALQENLESHADKIRKQYIQIAYKIGSAVIALPTVYGRDYRKLYHEILYHVINDREIAIFALGAKLEEICDYVEEHYEEIKREEIPRANLVSAGLTYYDRATRQAWEKKEEK